MIGKVDGHFPPWRLRIHTTAGNLITNHLIQLCLVEIIDDFEKFFFGIIPYSFHVILRRIILNIEVVKNFLADAQPLIFRDGIL